MAMTPEKFAAFIASCTWTFAKTMPNNPHEWTLKRDAVSRDGDDTTFCNAVLFIRKHGYNMTFGRTVYRCFDHGRHRYWTMGNSLEVTKLINRAVNP